MSRVTGKNKYVNTSKYNSAVTNPGKVTRIKSDNQDYHKASTLSSWLWMKYNMSYKSFRGKSKNRKKL